MSDLSRVIVVAGTPLFHGTDAPEGFKVPRGPAWFCHSLDEAARWAGWGSVARGPRRVLQVALTVDLLLLNTIRREDWDALCVLVDRDTTRGVAEAVKSRGWGGWVGRAEVLVADTCSLRPVGEFTVSDAVVPYGRPVVKEKPVADRVKCDVTEIQKVNDRGFAVPGLCATCGRCDHQSEVFGTGDKSRKAALARLRETCPEDESNYYVDSSD